jgi:hypothetical protein
MPPHRPSRRQLLGGLLAALSGWLWPARAQAASPGPKPLPGAAPSPGEVLRVTTCTYDAAGNCVGVRHELPRPAPPPALTCDPSGRLTRRTSYTGG